MMVVVDVECQVEDRGAHSPGQLVQCGEYVVVVMVKVVMVVATVSVVVMEVVVEVKLIFVSVIFGLWIVKVNLSIGMAHFVTVSDIFTHMCVNMRSGCQQECMSIRSALFTPQSLVYTHSPLQ